ncbi:MAG TPA: HEAT repeat domain-containing protein, partial [Opitutaceae bacterium]|nr:HEAT repeat domain-containing protein [Opitutaceae bacterium]
GVRTLVHDAEPEVRAQAYKVLGDRRDLTQQSAFVAALKDPSNRVKFFAAQALAKIARADAAVPVIEALRANNDEDAYLRRALFRALASTKNLPALQTAAADQSRAVRLGVLLAYRELRSAEAARFLRDADPLIVAEAARAINDAPINEALPALAAFIAERPVKSEAVATPAPDAAPASPAAGATSVANATTAANATSAPAQPAAPTGSSFTRDRAPSLTADDTFMVRVINANFRLGTAANAAAIAKYAARADVSNALRIEAISQLGNWAKPLARDRVVGIYRPLTPATRDASTVANALQPILADLLVPTTARAVQAAAITAIETLKINAAGDLLFAVVTNEQQAATTRAQALTTLAHLKYSRLAEAVRLAGDSPESALRLAALPIAADLEPEKAAPVVAKLGTQGTVAEQKVAFEALGSLHHADADVTIAAELRLLQAGQIAPEVQLELVEAAAKRDDPTVKELLAQYRGELAKSGDELAPFRVALKGGSAEKGRKLFNEHPVLACNRCHKVGDDGGGDAGPNLSTVGANNSREYLLESVVRPNAKIAPGFQNAVVTLKSGAVQSGTVTAEDETSLTLKLPDNSSTTLTKADVTKRESAPSSMPAIFDQILTKSELRDIVEYLAGLGANARGGPPAPGGPTGPPREIIPRALRGLTATP